MKVKLLIILCSLFGLSKTTFGQEYDSLGFKNTMGVLVGAGNNGIASSAGFDFRGFYQRTLTTKLDLWFSHGIIHSSSFNKEDNEDYSLVKRHLFQRTNISVLYVPLRKEKHEFKFGGGPQLAYVFRTKGPNIFVKDKSIAGGWVITSMYQAHPWKKATIGMYLNWEPLFGKDKKGVGNAFFGVVLGGRF